MAKNTRITFIGALSLLGLAAIGFFTFLGEMFFSSGSVGASLGIALAAVILPALILKCAVWCKEVDSDFAKWKKIEIAAVIAFWIVGLAPGLFVVHALEVVGQREQLARQATDDVNAVRSMFNDYERYERNALATTRTGLENALDQPVDEQTGVYMRQAAINSADGIDSWMTTQREMLLGSRGRDSFVYSRYRNNTDSLTGRWLEHIKGGDIMYLATHASDIEALPPHIVTDLNDNSSRGKLPVIEFSDGRYIIVQDAQVMHVKQPQLKFAAGITTYHGTVILYYIIYLLMLTLVFSAYIFAHRSVKVDIQDFGKTQGGTVL